MRMIPLHFLFFAAAATIVPLRAGLFDSARAEVVAGCSFLCNAERDTETTSGGGPAFARGQATNQDGSLRDSTAMAYASPGSGRLRVLANATEAYDSGSTALAYFRDRVSFFCLADLVTGECDDFVEDGIAEVKYHVHGKLEGWSSATAHLTIQGYAYRNEQRTWQSRNWYTNGEVNVNESIAHSFYISPKYLSPGRSYDIDIYMSLSAHASWIPRYPDPKVSKADMTNTGTLSINLPRGWYMRSSSGRLLEGEAVPEPATLGLTGVAFMAVAWFGRRRR